jgi:hypothetical protein
MLQYLKSNALATSEVTINRGRDISRAKFSKRKRGQPAIEVIKGRAIISDLTKKQIARVFGAADYVRASRPVVSGGRPEACDTTAKSNAAKGNGHHV